ncbi:MAG: hypothetical protein CMO47_00705 [Verrucomicrobiales bacterium]|nr:hypothetical protein [Verrucomicrobiales bacterium]
MPTEAPTEIGDDDEPIPTEPVSDDEVEEVVTEPPGKRLRTSAPSAPPTEPGPMTEQMPTETRSVRTRQKSRVPSGPPTELPEPTAVTELGAPVATEEAVPTEDISDDEVDATMPTRTRRRRSRSVPPPTEPDVPTEVPDSDEEDLPVPSDVPEEPEKPPSTRPRVLAGTPTYTLAAGTPGSLAGTPTGRPFSARALPGTPRWTLPTTPTYTQDLDDDYEELLDEELVKAQRRELPGTPPGGYLVTPRGLPGTPASAQGEPPEEVPATPTFTGTSPGYGEPEPPTPTLEDDSVLYMQEDEGEQLPGTSAIMPISGVEESQKRAAENAPEGERASKIAR